MTDDERTTTFENRLDTFGNDLGVLKNDVQRLRVLYEDHDTKINTIIEAQTHHTKVLDEIRTALTPLRDIDDFVKRIAHDHERRIQVLERQTG